MVVVGRERGAVVIIVEEEKRKIEEGINLSTDVHSKINIHSFSGHKYACT